MFIYIEEEIGENFNSNSIIDEFKNMNKWQSLCIIAFIVMVILNYVFIIFALVEIIKYINFDCIILVLPKILVKNAPLCYHRHQDMKLTHQRKKCFKRYFSWCEYKETSKYKVYKLLNGRKDFVNVDSF